MLPLAWPCGTAKAALTVLPSASFASTSCKPAETAAARRGFAGTSLRFGRNGVRYGTFGRLCYRAVRLLLLGLNSVARFFFHTGLLCDRISYRHN